MKAAACVTLTLLSFPLTFVNWSAKSFVLISSPLSSNGILEKVPQLLHICENVWAGLLQMMCPHWSSVSIHFYSGLEINSPLILCSPKITFDYGSFLGSIIFWMVIIFFADCPIYVYHQLCGIHHGKSYYYWKYWKLLYYILQITYTYNSSHVS